MTSERSERVEASKPTGKTLPLALTEAERESLQKLTKATKLTVAQRARVLLAIDQGQTSKAVAQYHQLHPTAVRRIKLQFQKQRLQALVPRPHTGRPPRKRVAVEEFLDRQGQRGMLQTPEQGVLSVADIQQKLQKEQKLGVCVNTVRNALKKRGLATDTSDTV